MCQIRADMVRVALTKILRAPFDFRHRMFRDGVYPLRSDQLADSARVRNLCC